MVISKARSPQTDAGFLQQGFRYRFRDHPGDVIGGSGKGEDFEDHRKQHHEA